MKNKKRNLVGLLVVAVIYYLFLHEPFQLVEDVPSMFKQDFEVKRGNSTAWISKNNNDYYPIIHDDKDLYILNGAGNDFKDYSVNYEQRELIIEKDVANLNTRRKSYFQLVTIPKEDYESIIQDGKIRVRIEYLYFGGFKLLEYDFKSQEVTIIQGINAGK